LPINVESRLPFKYAPTKFEDVILNQKIKKSLKKTFQEIPTMFLVGPRGIGKGSFVDVFLRETKLDYIWINGSDEKGIDIVRNKLWNFATALGNTELKVVVINEIDRFLPDSQKALLDKIEKVEKITRFIFIGNNNSLIPELLSRCQVFEFSEPPADEIFKRCCLILDNEKVKYNKKTLVEIIKKKYPDIRQTLHTIDQNIINKTLSDDFIIYDQTLTYSKILDWIVEYSEENIENIRKTLKSKSIDYEELYSYLFENIEKFNNIPRAIIALGDAVRYNNLVGLKEINFMRFIMEVIINGK